MKYTKFVFSLPDWVKGFLAQHGQNIPNIEDRMKLAIELSRLNVEHGTGGPFGAGIFEQETGKLVAVGINLVESINCSIAHAEMTAIMMAQRELRNYDLGRNGMPAYELVTSTEPCAMCLGAIGWSGVRMVVCGARGQDAESIGFDEGAKPIDWVESLENRGIEVVRDVLRNDAREVLLKYKESGGLIYNARKSDA